jgi:hypothetical protein
MGMTMRRETIPLQCIRILLLILAVAGLESAALAASGGITLETSFSYPGSGVSTVPEGINNAGNIVVDVAFTATGEAAGYERYANGTFSAALNDPDSAENTTGGSGINDSGEIDGTYQQSTISYDYGFSFRTVRTRLIIKEQLVATARVKLSSKESTIKTISWGNGTRQMTSLSSWRSW